MKLPLKIRIALCAAVIAAALGGGYYVYYRIDKAGYDRRTDEYKAAEQAAKTKAQANVAKTEKEYAPKLKEIYEAPDNDSVVGPLTTHAIDGL